MALAQHGELVGDIEAAGDRGADGRDLLGEPKEDRAHDAAVRHHELAVTPGGVFEGGRPARPRPIVVSSWPSTFCIVTGTTGS